MIDITKPLELSDGTPVRYVRSGVCYDCYVTWEPNGGAWFSLSGKANNIKFDRTLRNVKEAPKMENDLAARMETLVRAMASDEPMSHNKYAIPHNAYREAKAILAELDGPKTDEEWADGYAKHWQADMATPLPSARLTSLKAMALNCIAKGRELERMNNTVGKS